MKEVVIEVRSNDPKTEKLYIQIQEAIISRVDGLIRNGACRDTIYSDPLVEMLQKQACEVYSLGYSPVMIIRDAKSRYL